MSFRPDLTVAAVVERDGRYLLIEERVGNRMVFNQPAGHVEKGETFLQAAIRETLEETARDFVPEAVIGIYTWEQPEKQKSFLRVAFTGRVSEQYPSRPLDRGIVRALWMTREQVITRSSRLRSPMVLKCIDDYVSGKRFTLDLLNHFPGAESPSQVKSEARALGLLRASVTGDV